MARIWGWPPAIEGAYGCWTKKQNLVLDLLLKEWVPLKAKKTYGALSAINPQIGLSPIYRHLRPSYSS